jgi:hypothetical protein
MVDFKILIEESYKITYDDILEDKFKGLYYKIHKLISDSHFHKRTEYLGKLDAIKNSILDLPSVYDDGDVLLFRKEQKKLIAFLRLILDENKKIFIVHGRDISMRDKVSSLLGRLKIDYTILETETNGGQTVIEKFIANAKDCEYAIILFSGDDVGRLNITGENERARARQNVVLELGYFLSKVGRKNLVIFYTATMDIEKPSDFAGIVYEPFDPYGAWKSRLIREMRTAGIYVDQQLADKS